MPSESDPVYVEQVLEGQVESSNVWLCKEAFQDLKMWPQAWGFHCTQKTNDMIDDQLVSDLSTYVKERAQRQDDAIFFRHMDDVVGTGPKENLMKYVEHIKTIL